MKDHSAALEDLKSQGHAVLGNQISASVDDNYQMAFHHDIPPVIIFASYRASFTLLVGTNDGPDSPVHTFKGSESFPYSVPPGTTSVSASVKDVTDAGWWITTSW